jgi:hypothetical protein
MQTQPRRQPLRRWQATPAHRAKDCTIDTVGAVVYGNAAPTGRVIVRMAELSGALASGVAALL